MSRLGGVFTDRDEESDTQTMESIFKYAIFNYNRLPLGYHNLSYKIRIQEETLNLISSESPIQTVYEGSWNSLTNIKRIIVRFYFASVCSLIQQRRIQGIFGPPYNDLATVVHSIAHHVSIPFINVCSTCYPIDNFDDEFDESFRSHHMTINLYPSNYDLNIAFHNLTHQLEWTRFLIIYDSDSGKENEHFPF